MIIQWGNWKETPEWFDHNIDLYYSWGTPTGNPYWLERGIFSLLALKRDGHLLELCCGDGFNSKFFYSYKAKTITSVDFDLKAISHAQSNNKTSVNSFEIVDIRYNMPDGIYDNIVWDAAIEHFTPEEINIIMKNIKSKLLKDGILSGYTIVEKASGKYLEQHEYEFKSKEDLMRFLSPWFVNVKVFETIYPDRHNLYFWASDAILPFDKEWEFMLENINK